MKPTTMSRYTALTGPTELRNDPHHARRRGAQAGLLADIPGAIPDMLNLGSDYFYSGLNSLLDVGDLSPYDIPRSLGIHPSQRQPIGPTSGQIEQNLVREGMLAPTTDTTAETVSRVGAGFAEGAGPAVAGVIKKSPAFFSGLLSAAQKLPAKGTHQQMRKGLLKGGAKEAEIEEIGLDDWMGQESPIDEDVAYRDYIVDYIEDNQIQLEEVTHTGEKTKWSSHVEPGGEDYKELVLTLPDRTLDELDLSHGFKKHVQGKNLRRLDHHWGHDGLDRIANPVVHVRFNERVSSSGDDVLFLEEIQSDWANAGLKRGFTGTRQDLMDRVIDDAVKSGMTREQATEDVNTILTSESPLQHNERTFRTPWKRLHNALKEGVPPQHGRGAMGGEARGSISETLNYLFVDTKNLPMGAQINTPRAAPDAPFVKNPNQWSRLALGRMLRYAADNGFDKLAWTTGRTQAKRWGELENVKQIRYKKQGPRAATNFQKLKGLPLEKTNVYDIDTYSSSSVRGRGDTSNILSTERMTLGMIRKKFGQEVADRIESGATAKGWPNAYGEGSGSIDVDVEVGGESKKVLYDQVYVNTMKKLVKKMGGEVKREVLRSSKGAKVVRTRHEQGHDSFTEYFLELEDGTRIRSEDDTFAGRSLLAGRVQGLGLHTHDKLKAVYDGEMDISELRLDQLLADYNLDAWTVTIPRGWKKKIKEGLPLFSALPAAGLLGAGASTETDGQ